MARKRRKCILWKVLAGGSRSRWKLRGYRESEPQSALPFRSSSLLSLVKALRISLQQWRGLPSWEWTCLWSVSQERTLRSALGSQSTTLTAPTNRLRHSSHALWQGSWWTSRSWRSMHRCTFLGRPVCVSSGTHLATSYLWVLKSTDLTLTCLADLIIN